MKLKYTTNQINRFLIVAVILLLITIAFLIGRSPSLFQPISLIKPTSTLLPTNTPIITPTITTEPLVAPVTTIPKENNKTNNCDENKEDLFRVLAKQNGYSESETEEFLSAMKKAGCPEIKTDKVIYYKNSQPNMHCTSDFLGGFYCYSY